jgi:hypothetical protein
MKTARGPSRPQPAPRPIRRFVQPAPGPHHNPPPATPTTPSNKVAADAIRIAKHPPGIDGRQQRN